jgi:hypothetical protein
MAQQNKCGIARIYDSLSDEDRDALRALLASTFYSSAIVRELAAANIKTTENIVYKHRNAKCACKDL